MSADGCSDYGADGHPDLILKFERQAFIAAVEIDLGRELVEGEIMNLELKGELQDGTPFSGEDVVIIKNKGK